MSKLAPDPEVLATARARIPLVQRFPFEVRYARELHWIEVRDPFTGEWLQVFDQDAPSSWRRRAYAEKLQRRREVEQLARVSRQTVEQEEEVFAF